MGLGDLFAPAQWFAYQYREHVLPSVREQEARATSATGQPRKIEKPLASFLAGPVCRVAHYSAVHAIYGAFDVGLAELCREIATQGRQPKKSSSLWRFFDFLRDEIERQTGRQVTIPVDEPIQAFVAAFVQVRNCIAHARGDVTLLRTEHAQLCVRAAAELLGLSLSGDKYLAMTNERCSGLISDAQCWLAAIAGDVETALAPRPT